MKVGFVGVGLIGGSMLKRLSKCGVDCFVSDINKQVLDVAIKENNAKILTDYSSVDVIVIALSPNNTVKFLEQNATKIGTTLVVDVCGVKNPIEQIALQYGFNYCGIHPMAGREVGGYFNSKEDLFTGANVVITTEKPPQIVYEIIHMLGFGNIVYTDAKSHDKIISYTSQLCHILSNAYAKNPSVNNCEGFTGGSFEDLTRVGKMDSNLWIELFDNNRDNLICDISCIINELQNYLVCLKNKDNVKLKKLIDDGSNILINATKK